MSSSRFGTCILGLLLLVTATGCRRVEAPPTCTDIIGCVVLGPEEAISLGVLQALSGKVAPLGIEQIRGFELALEARGGKVAGHLVSMQTVDCGCTGEGGANAALKVVADPQSVAIFGTTCSSAAATASKVMSDAGLTMISGNNSAPFLTAIGGNKAPQWQPGYFRTAPNEEYSGQAAATYAFTQLGIRRAATINDGDIYTRGLTEGFIQTFRRLGGEIVLDTTIDKGDAEMNPVLTAVAASRAELLFFPLFQPEGNNILAQARHMKELDRVHLMSDGALIEQTFITAMGSQAQGMYFIGPSSADTPASRRLADAYQRKFGEKARVSYYQTGYDAAALLLQAIEQTAVRRPDGSLSIGRDALRRNLYQTRAFDGVTGRLSCNQFGDCANPVFNVLRLDDPKAGVEGLQSNVLFTYTPFQEAGRKNPNGGREAR